MNFSERPPSQQWAALKYRGKPFAEVWFKPEGEPLALTFRVPRTSFEIVDTVRRLTAERLLNAVGIATEEVESWRHEGAAHSSLKDLAELSRSLPPPLRDVPYLHLHIRLNPTSQAVTRNESCERAIPEARLQELETRWNTILGFEASMDTLRISMDALRAEMEAAVRKTLTGNDKFYALNADVAQWTKAKSRVQFALPKVKEFIHRATWAMGAPERKKLQELFKDRIRPRIPFPQMDQVADHLESLLKDRQVFTSHGLSVYQECKTIAAEVQGALRTLQRNAAARATKKRAAAGVRGKSR